MEVFVLTAGQFSLIDLISHILDGTGPADAVLATWTAAGADLRRVHSFLLAKKLRALRLLVDPSFRARQPDFCAVATDLFGDAIRTIPLHGKFCALRNDAWSIAIRSSMNLNENRRIESIEVSADPDLVDFLFSFADEVFAKSPDANFASQSRSQLARHTTGSKLSF